MESGSFAGCILLVALIAVVLALLVWAPRGLSRRAGTLLLMAGGTVLFWIGTLLHP